jgi:hypothetical protein
MKPQSKTLLYEDKQHQSKSKSNELLLALKNQDVTADVVNIAKRQGDIMKFNVQYRHQFRATEYNADQAKI